MYDLRHFALFFTILIAMLSLLFGIIGLGKNDRYEVVGPFVGNLMETLKLSMGDTEVIDESVDLSDIENYMFWSFVFFDILFGFIIFMNFILAEAGESYNKVKE